MSPCPLVFVRLSRRIRRALSQKRRGGALAVVAAALIYAVTFVLHEGEGALTVRFGSPVRVLAAPRDAGGHLAWPWPIEKVYRYDMRERIFQGDLEEAGQLAETGDSMGTTPLMASHCKAAEVHPEVPASQFPPDGAAGAPIPPGVYTARHAGPRRPHVAHPPGRRGRAQAAPRAAAASVASVAAGAALVMNTSPISTASQRDSRSRARSSGRDSPLSAVEFRRRLEQIGTVRRHPFSRFAHYGGDDGADWLFVAGDEYRIDSRQRAFASDASPRSFNDASQRIDSVCHASHIGPR